MSCPPRRRPQRPARILWISFLLLSGGLLPACNGGSSPQPGTPAGKVQLQLELLVDGLNEPLGLETAGDDSGRLFVIEKGGLIRVVQDGQLLNEPLLDIADRITDQDESGLLGVAFHPQFAENRQVFVHYSQAGTNYGVIERFTVSGDQVDPGSELILTAEREFPSSFHNGGQLAFGPEDGYLYVALGDATIPGASQDTGTLLGALLRLDVNASSYEVPADNPLVDDGTARGEIWAYGLRNPWRFSFDRETGDLWIADVGEDSWEEVNFQPAGSPGSSSGGQNYGWSIMEGSHCFSSTTTCDQSGLTLPRIEYARSGSHCSVTGGFVYRGSEIPALQGSYLFGDFCSGTIWTAEAADSWEPRVAFAGDSGSRRISLSSFGQDDTGELYAVDYGGAVYRLVEAD